MELNIKLKSLIFLSSLLWHLASNASSLSFVASDTNTIQANEGHVTLKWMGEGERFTLKKSGERILYEGKGKTFFITGLNEGAHQFFIENSFGEKAKVTVEVNYPKEYLVWVSLFTGTFLFLSLCLIIIFGNKKYANTPS